MMKATAVRIVIGKNGRRSSWSLMIRLAREMALLNRPNMTRQRVCLQSSRSQKNSNECGSLFTDVHDQSLDWCSLGFHFFPRDRHLGHLPAKILQVDNYFCVPRPTILSGQRQNRHYRSSTERFETALVIRDICPKQTLYDRVICEREHLSQQGPP